MRRNSPEKDEELAKLRDSMMYTRAALHELNEYMENVENDLKV